MGTGDSLAPNFDVKNKTKMARVDQGSRVSPVSQRLDGETTSLKSSSPSFACAMHSFSSSTAPSPPMPTDPNRPEIVSKEIMDKYYLGVREGGSFTEDDGICQLQAFCLKHQPAARSGRRKVSSPIPLTVMNPAKAEG